MGLNKYKLGDLIELILDTNSELLYGPNDVMGMTITKEIIPTKADVKDTDLSKFLVVNPNEFIYNPRTHGKKIGFGYNSTENPFIISWNNIAFRVKSSMKKEVLADYLFLHFKRDEWDREACFQSWGSSTEVFSWSTLCDMSIDLPSLPIQQKYVDIYNAMLANQKCYERGLDDLKLTCDAYIDKLKQRVPTTTISSILEEVNMRNLDGGITNVYGINILKQFMPSVANTHNVDLRKYKLVDNDQFAFSGMQTGRDECIRIALYKGETATIISPAYTVFRLKESIAVPEYLMLWFSRTEVDRLGCFMSDASIRTNLDLDRFYEIKIPMPPIKVQQDIVSIYTVYKERQAINERLKAQIKDICPILIKGSLEEVKKLQEA